MPGAFCNAKKKKKRLKTTKQEGAYNKYGSCNVCLIKKKKKRLNYVGRKDLKPLETKLIQHSCGHTVQNTSDMN